MVGTAGTGQLFKAEAVGIKKEPGVFIKSEFEPRLASLPMAPVRKSKNEAVDDKKPVFASFPERPSHAGRSRRRHFGNSLVLRMNGYHIRAHYGHGKVDFTVTNDGQGTRTLNWAEVEREMFHKLHRARFFIEPTERPGAFLQKFCSSYSSGVLRFSVGARNVHPSPNQSITSSAHSQVYKTEFKEEQKDSSASERSGPAVEPPQPESEFAETPFPANLPKVSTWHLDAGKPLSNAAFKVFF